MRKTWFVALALAATLSACSGSGGSPKKTATPTETRSIKLSLVATSTPVPAPPPAKPASFSDYAPAIAAYLTSAPSAADGCLSALYAAWQMPLISAAGSCLRANTDADPVTEIVAVISSKLGTPTAISDTQYEIVVFDADAAGAYRVAYESQPNDVAPPGRTDPIAPLLAAGDLTGDGSGEFAYETDNCGAHTCVTTVHILRGGGNGYDPLPPADGISIETADTIKFVDAGGKKDLVLTGGVIGSVGAGPPRERTDTWSWNGAAYALTNVQPAPPVYLYHAITDADARFAAADYKAAESMYAASVGDENLKVWTPDKNERNELESYALFRAAVSVLMANGDAATAAAYLDRAKAYANTLHAQLAASFEAAYAAKSSVGIACGAVSDDIQANLTEYQQFWDFGYANPKFDPAAVCPT